MPCLQQGNIWVSTQRGLPCQYDEEVQYVPSLLCVALLANEAHSCDFNYHFQKEEGEYDVIKDSEDPTARCCTSTSVQTWLVHAQSEAVQQNHEYHQSLKPCMLELSKQGSKTNTYSKDPTR